MEKLRLPFVHDMEKSRLPFVHDADHYIDPERVKFAALAVKNGKDTPVRSAAAKFGTNRSTCEVEVAAKPKYYCQMNINWPSKLVYPGNHCLGIGTLELKDIVRPLCNDGRNAPWNADGIGTLSIELKDILRPLCNDGRNAPWNPDEPTGGQTKLDLRASSRGTRDGRYVRSSRVYEADRVTTDDTVRLEDFRIM